MKFVRCVGRLSALRKFLNGLFLASALGLGAGQAYGAYSLVMTNGYGDVYHMNLLRNRDNYQAYRGVCSYRGFSLSGCSTTGEVVMLRIKATPSMPEHFSLLSTSMRWGTTQYVLNDVFSPLCSWVMAGYENWYPFDMSCSVAMYINAGGLSSAETLAVAGPSLLSNPSDSLLSGVGEGFSLPDPSLWRWPDSEAPPDTRELMSMLAESAPAASGSTPGLPAPAAYSLVMTNGYGDVYRMNLLRNRDNYQAYRGVCSYRGFSLSGCSTTGEVVMLRIKATPSMPEYFSLVSTSLRWGSVMYFLNDVFHPLSSTVMAGYENWYPFDMSCSVAMYINSGGLGSAETMAAEPPLLSNPYQSPGGTNVLGVLLPSGGDLDGFGPEFSAAYGLAFADVTNTPGMPPFRLLVENTATDPVLALEKLKQFHTQGVQVVLGPTSSSECEGLLEYANQNGMLLFSSTATALPLAKPADNLMRMIPSDSHQSRVLAERIMADGVTHLALLTRSDMYGEGMRNAFVGEYQALGGHIFTTNYLPRVEEFLPEVVANVNDLVTSQVAETGADSLGLLMVVYEEGAVILAEAAAYPALMSARWYATDAFSQEVSMLANPASLSAAWQSQLLCSEPSAYTNARYGEVSAAIAAETGTVPRSFSMYCYDSLWLAALALQDIGGTGTVAQVRQAIRTRGLGYAGATGPVTFDTADDRADGLYQFHRVNSATNWVNADDVAPSAPSAREATAVKPTRLTIRWGSSAGATSYWLDVALDPEFTEFLPGYENAAMGNNRYAELVGLNPSCTYYYRTRAGNAAGVSEFSDGIPVRTSIPPPLSLIAGQNLVTADGRVIRWKSLENRHYTVQRATNLVVGPRFTNWMTGVPGLLDHTSVTDTTDRTEGFFYYRIMPE